MVLGAARSGMSVARLLQKNGAEVLLSDKAPLESKKEEAARLAEWKIAFEFGEHSSRILAADFWVVSPGIPLDIPPVKTALQRGIPVFGELEVASWFCRAPIVAVTGSNGKSTVTSLLGKVFEKNGTPCVVAGNIGDPFANQVENTEENGVAVVEVSSFQLETIEAFHPRISIYLNISPDHLDRHGSMANYARIKARIFENQTGSDFLIYNALDPVVSDLSTEARCRKAVFGQYREDMPCGYVKHNNLVLKLQDQEEIILDIGKMGICGEHNVANALAVSLAACFMDVPVKALKSALIEFKGLPHRMEFVREKEGVTYINDSKGTNLDSVFYALGSYQQPVILIAGGRNKKADFRLLKERIREKTRILILLGEAASEMETAFKGIKPIYHVRSLAEAVKKAAEVAQRGDVVLLSPACASFDMFKNFEDRGDQFKKLVREL